MSYLELAYLWISFAADWFVFEVQFLKITVCLLVLQLSKYSVTWIFLDGTVQGSCSQMPTSKSTSRFSIPTVLFNSEKLMKLKYWNEEFAEEEQS